MVKMDLLPLNQDNEKDWTEYIKQNEHANFYNTVEMKKIMEKVYGFTPLYYIAYEGNQVKGAICAFLTKSIFFGKKISSLPYNFYNQPIFDDTKTGEALLQKIVDIGKEKSVKSIVLKSVVGFDDDVASKIGFIKQSHYYTSILQLKENPEETVKAYDSRLTKNLRTLKRNAEKNGIEIKEAKSLKEVEQFYDMMLLLYRDKHNMITQPFSLFKSMYEDLSEEKKFSLLIALKNEKVIGGMVRLYFNNRVMYAYGSSDERYKNFSPSSLLIDHTIRTESEKGNKTLDFGVTSPYQESLLNFKSSWGAVPHKLPFYYYLIEDKQIVEKDYYNSYTFLRKPFKYVPAFLIKKMCPLVTRQFV